MTDFTEEELARILHAEHYLAQNRGFGNHPMWEKSQHDAVVDKITRELAHRDHLEAAHAKEEREMS